jgi:hypothetical protein
VRAAQYWWEGEGGKDAEGEAAEDGRRAPGWRLLPGGYVVDAAHSLADVRLSAPLTVRG